jgi:ADP-ribose pyrophosphatase YjhB (NUDIX family)
VGVGAIIVDGGRVLLLKRTKEPEAGCWGIQGGAIEFGETTEEAARRELRVELGVECEIVRLLGITDHILPGEGIHWISPVFLAKIETGTPKNAEPEKHSEMRWLTWKTCRKGGPCPRRTPSSFCASTSGRRGRRSVGRGRVQPPATGYWRAGSKEEVTYPTALVHYGSQIAWRGFLGSLSFSVNFAESPTR